MMGIQTPAVSTSYTKILITPIHFIPPLSVFGIVSTNQSFFGGEFVVKAHMVLTFVAVQEFTSILR
jgi:hypothetical protein